MAFPGGAWERGEKMNTARIKAYAPKARRDFIKAVTE